MTCQRIIATVTKDLHWLPILARVRYKVLLVVAKSQKGLALRYLCELMSKPLSARSSRPLCSADRSHLVVPWSLGPTSLSQNRAFAVVGPALWNDTPPALRSVMLQGMSPASLRNLKTFLFTFLSCWERRWTAFCERRYTNIHIIQYNACNFKHIHCSQILRHQSHLRLV